MQSANGHSPSLPCFRNFTLSWNCIKVQSANGHSPSLLCFGILRLVATVLLLIVENFEGEGIWGLVRPINFFRFHSCFDKNWQHRVSGFRKNHYTVEIMRLAHKYLLTCSGSRIHHITSPHIKPAEMRVTTGFRSSLSHLLQPHAILLHFVL